MNSKKTVSIIDIARLAGVSTATVSHVLNKSGRYSKETEEKVKSVIDKYGYVSNNAARSLKSSSSRTVGLIMPNINNDFFSTIAVSIEQFFDYNNYSLFICNTDNDPQKERRYFHKLDSMQVDGIMVISCQNLLESDLVSRDIPILLIDRTPINSMNLHIVASDVKTGMFKATEKLIEKGCRNIIFVSSYLATYVKTNRKDGYLEAMHKHNLKADQSTVIQLPKGSSLINTETAVIEYLDAGNKIDGIICTSDNQAISAMMGLKRKGLRVPEDVKVFGFDNQLQSRICTPSLSTIERNPSAMGNAAAETLLKLIKKQENIPETLIFDCSLIERDSTKQ
ncbi:MAG: LacI family DNA-binding transcriptional regulator [Erysipelotrichaceae bacterium]|nr:LacI family DNA-binding transcriptional regulator [Erysipelotrichaceae bacterium]